MHFSQKPQEGDRSSDSLYYKIRPQIELFNQKLKETHSLGKELSQDESMILWCG